MYINKYVYIIVYARNYALAITSALFPAESRGHPRGSPGILYS